MKCNKLNLKTMVLLFFTLSGLRQAHALTSQICTDQSGRIKIVIQQGFNKRVIQIEFFEDTQLRAKDTLMAQACHVGGVIYFGTIFSYGGCYQSNEEPSNFLTWDKFFRSSSEENLELINADLSTFNCVNQ